MTPPLVPSSTSAALLDDARVQQLLREAVGAISSQPTFAWWVPGRVEILGKHTDYAGGQVLNCATDLGLIIAARPRDDDVVSVISDRNRVEIPLTTDGEKVGGLGTYVSTVVRRLRRHFPSVCRGVDIGIASNLPAASGMSSSSAIVIAIHHAICAVNDLTHDAVYARELATPENLIPYLGCHENGASYKSFAGEAGVGTSGGSQDHAAVMMSQSGQLNQFSFAPFHRIGTVAWPEDLVLAVAVSGVLAEKSAAARADFNRVADSAHAAAAAWRAVSGRQDPTIGAAVLACGAQRVLSSLTDPELRRRSEQTVIETTEIVPGAVSALANNDHATFGALTARSMAMAISHLQNQIPETIALVNGALEHGAIAASAFGAGFGGAVWAAFPRTHDDSGAWLADYLRQYPQHSKAQVHHIAPGPGVTELELS